MSSKPAYDPDFAIPAEGRRSLAQSLFIRVLVTLAIVATGIMLFLPAVRTAGGAAKRSQCVNNLKQIGLALHNYEQQYRAFPPAMTVDAQGHPLHSWRTLILPFVELDHETRKTLDAIDLSRPWDDPVNQRARETALRQYHCPSSGEPENTTTYFASCGADGCLAPHTPRPMAEITDDHGNTLMVIEAAESKAVPWMKPTDGDAAALERLTAGMKTHHPGGSNALFVDGSVRFLKNAVPAATLRRLATIAGGEPISPDEF